MQKTCDICLPQHRGYTFYFEKNQSPTILEPYYATYQNSQWQMIDEETIWMEAEAAADIVEYLESHFDKQSIYFSNASKGNPLQSKENRRPLHHFHSEKKLEWIDKIIDQRRLVSYYQPIVHYDGTAPRIIGHELLSRGVGEKGEIISPFQMLQAARTRNRLFALDRACRITCVENANLIRDQWIFINFIPTAIYVPEHCLATTIQIINKLGIAPEHVVFEVVESDEVQDISHLKTILDYYKKHGFKYALDDIGTGTNSLKKLAYLEPHVVKLAREYVDGICRDKEKQHMAQSLMQVAYHIGAQLLAEGVETKEDMDYLQKMGYELFQGYYLSKPQSIPVTKVGGDYDS